MSSSPALAIEAIDRAISAVESVLDTLRRERAALTGAGAGEAMPVREAAPEDAIELGLAAARFGLEKDTLRLWARRHPSLAIKAGGRWLIFPTRLRKFLNGQHS